MFGITLQDTNGITYGFVIDTVAQVRQLVRQARQDYGTVIVKATYRNEELNRLDRETLAYGQLEWDYWGGLYGTR